MTSEKTNSTTRVALTQAEPAYLDLKKAVEKTCSLIEEAASNGAQLVTFPEAWIPGYPSWIWSRPLDPELGIKYIKNSLRVKSPEMDQIRECAANNNIAVCLGFSENDNDSLYIAQSLIENDGTISMTRRKIKATHMERTIFGDASGDCLRNVVDTSAGRVGALACWEHAQPLLKYHTHLQREQIHVGAWPPVTQFEGLGLYSMSREGCTALSQVYAIEAQSFVLQTTAVLGQTGIDLMKTHGGLVMGKPGGGCSAAFAPDGKLLTEYIPDTEEGIVYADLALDEILMAKQFLDTCGHYSRPDMLHLGVDSRQKEHRRDV